MCWSEAIEQSFESSEWHLKDQKSFILGRSFRVHIGNYWGKLKLSIFLLQSHLFLVRQKESRDWLFPSGKKEMGTRRPTAGCHDHCCKPPGPTYSVSCHLVGLAASPSLSGRTLQSFLRTPPLTTEAPSVLAFPLKEANSKAGSAAERQQTCWTSAPVSPLLSWTSMEGGNQKTLGWEAKASALNPWRPEH